MFINVLLHGSSISNLKNYINKLDMNDLFVTLNDFWLVECLIDNIGKQFDYIFNSADLPGKLNEYIGYINKNKNVKIVTSPLKNNVIKKFFEKEYELIKNNLEVSECVNGYCNGFKLKHNTLSALLFYFLKIGYKKFRLFGCDGNGVKYFNSDFKNEYAINLDTKVMNETFWMRARCFGIKNDDVEILNVNKDSFVNCFKKIGYEDL